MIALELAKRNFKEAWRDWVSLGVNAALPAAMLVVLQALESVDEFFSATSLAPGVAVFGFAMLTMSSALTLAQDRESSLFARLLTAPLRSNDFVTAYSLPYLAVALIQLGMVFAIGAIFGLSIAGNAALVLLILMVMAVWYVAMGMILGSVLPYKGVSAGWTAVLLLTIFGGSWVNLEDIGGGFRTVADLLPFAHALDASRAVMIDGAGFGAIATDFYWVLIYTVATVGLAVFLFRRRMVE